MPLFVSRRRLEKLNRLPVARGPWAMDSGGFTELSLHGCWSITVRQYVEEVRRCMECVGNLQWAASCDYMVEPDILAKTGLTVERHQELTIDNFLEARNLAPELPIIPVLQGWTWGDYPRHEEQYARRGIDLSREPVVGVGTGCRRQSTTRFGTTLATLRADLGDRLHSFGLKIRGLELSQEQVISADSLAWSYAARRKPPLPGCEHAHCNNCIRWALRWRQKVMQLLGKDDGPPAEPAAEPLLF